MASSGMLRHVAIVRIEVLEELIPVDAILHLRKRCLEKNKCKYSSL
jgi:hypothetical protein